MKIGDRVYIEQDSLIALLNNKNYSDIYYYLIMCPYWIVSNIGFYKKKTLQDMSYIGRNECSNIHCKHNKCIEELLLFSPLKFRETNVFNEPQPALQLPAGILKNLSNDKNEELDYIIRSRACPFCFDSGIYSKLILSDNKRWIYCNESDKHSIRINVSNSLAFIKDGYNNTYGYNMHSHVVIPISLRGKRLQNTVPPFSAYPLDVQKMPSKLNIYVLLS